MIFITFIVYFFAFSVPFINGLDSDDGQQMYLEGMVEEEYDGNGYEDDVYSDEIGNINRLAEYTFETKFSSKIYRFA